MAPSRRRQYYATMQWNHVDTGVCETNISFMRALVMQSSGKDCPPAPDLVIWEPIFQRVFFPEGLFSQTPVCDAVQIKGRVMQRTSLPLAVYKHGRVTRMTWAATDRSPSAITLNTYTENGETGGMWPEPILIFEGAKFPRA